MTQDITFAEIGLKTVRRSVERIKTTSPTMPLVSAGSDGLGGSRSKIPNPGTIRDRPGLETKMGLVV